MSTNTGHWSAQGLSLDPEHAEGFVYLIIEKDTSKAYIGLKHYRLRGKRKGQQSNWKTYTSSSTWVKQLIAERGVDNFDFIILEQYYTRGGLSFAEVWTQVSCEIPSQNEKYFNRFIDKITFKVTEPVTPRHKKRLKYYLRKYKLA